MAGFLLIALLFHSPVAAAQSPDSLRAVEIHEVVVTGTRTPRRLAESPVLTTLIGEGAIRRAAAVSALEALQDNIPGMVSTPNEMGNNLTIRGLSSRYILMLVDGERLTSEGANGNVNLDQVEVGSIRRIEVVDGAASALYGSNAVGGVINIITKEPTDGLQIGAGQSFQNHNTWRSNLDIGTAQKRFSARAGAFRNSSDGFGASGGGPYAARYEDWGANLKLGYKPSERSDVNLTGRWFRHETFNRQGSMSSTHPLTDNLTFTANGGFATDRNSFRVSASFDKFFDNDVLQRRKDQKALQNTATYFSTRAVDTFTPNERWELVGGVEYDHQQSYSRTALGPTPTRKSVDEGAVFAQAAWKPAENLEAILGGRYTLNSRFGSALSPKLSLMYTLGGWRFRGGIGTAFRTPSIRELYYNFDHQGMFWIYGNPDLRPERGLYTSLSAQYTFGSLDVSVAGYLNRIDDKITRYDVLSDEGKLDKYYKNVSRATLQGVDVSLAYTLWDELTLRGTYSFCDAADGSSGRQLDGNVKHSGTFSATWNGHIARSPFSLQLAGRAGSAFTYYTETGGTITSKGYRVLKAVLAKPFTIAARHTLEVVLKVDNLLDFHHAAFIDPGRTFTIGLKYNFR